jgi:putative transposase
VLDHRQCKLVDGFLVFPKALNIPPNIVRDREGGRFVMVRIVPDGNQYKLEILKEKEKQKHIETSSRIIGIDPGVNNFATVVNNFYAEPFFINGRPLKAINQFYNKRKAFLMQCVGDKGTSRKLQALERNRNNKMRTLMGQASSYIIKWAIKNKADTIVIGANEDWKRDMKKERRMGVKTRQSFQYIPFKSFRDKIASKCEDNGIIYKETEESHTSKCSFIDNENIEHHDQYAGKRIKRGLFKSSNGSMINADVNGGYNIIKKVFPDAFAEGIERCLSHPKCVEVFK